MPSVKYDEEDPIGDDPIDGQLREVLSPSKIHYSSVKVIDTE